MEPTRSYTRSAPIRFVAAGLEASYSEGSSVVVLKVLPKPLKQKACSKSLRCFDLFSKLLYYANFTLKVFFLQQYVPSVNRKK